jgi:DNA-3-methyladenine glycosylase II
MGVSRFELEVSSPFCLGLTVWALRRRAHNAIDTWDGTWYRRTVVLGGRPVGLAVRQEPDDGRARSVLVVEVRAAGSPPDDAELTEARHLLEQTLGLGVDLSGFYSLVERDRRLVPLAHRFVGMRPPRLPSVFEALVNAVACQQLSLTVGIHLLTRLARCYGPTLPGRMNAPAGFPTPESLAGADPPHLRILGFSHAKARTLTLLARRVASGDVDLVGLEDLDDKAAVAALAELPGIGRWSAEYTLLRGLGRWHVLPGDDVGARNNLRRRFGLAADAGYDDVADLSRSWSPYGGIVYFHLLLDGLDRAGKLGDGWELADDGEPERAREPSSAPVGRHRCGEVA